MCEQSNAPVAPPAAAVTPPEKPARNATWRMQGRGSEARRQLLRHVSSGPAPACGQQPCGMARLRRPEAARGSDSAYSETHSRHVSGQRHCSLLGPRAPARRARPLHLLRPAALQRVRNDAASALSLPPRLAGAPNGGRGGGRSRRGGRGRDQTETSGGASRRAAPRVRGTEDRKSVV